MPLPTLLRPARFTLTLAIGAALVALSACNLQIGTGIEARDTWTRTYQVKAGATLEIRETNGRIHVEAADGDAIEVTATRIAKAPTEEAAKAMLKEFTIGETATADRVELGGGNSGTTFSLNRSRRVDYAIKVPRSVAVTVKSTNSEVDVKGIGGLLRVETVNASITASELANGADVSATNGEVNLEFGKLGDAGVRCKLTNGQIVVTVPRSAKATVSGRIVNGDIAADNLTIETTEKSSRRLEGTIGGGGPEIRLELTNGELRLVGK